MKSKLGPIMFQFEYLNKNKMPSLRTFLERLGEFFVQIPSGYPYAIEVRNPNYLKTDYFSFLKQYNIGTVLLEGYYMPPIDKVVADNDVYTSDFLVIRLHGPDREDIEAKTKGLWNQIIEPHDNSLRNTANIVQNSVARGFDTFVNFNNHYEGCAPLSIQRLVALL